MADLRKNGPRVRDWQKRNPEKKQQQIKRRYARKIARLRELKAKPCADCGIQYHYAVMQFDHVRGEKKFNLAGSCVLSHSYEMIEEEATKCEVVCANCHAMRTWKRRVGVA